MDELATKKITGARNYVDTYILKDGRRLHLLAEGRLINLAAAEGHPASVMDMSFATQALTAEYSIKNNLKTGVHQVPQDIEDWIAHAKLASMGIRIDRLTAEQEKYLASWEMGT